MKKKSIDKLIKNVLCTGCGTCSALCPVQAITIHEQNGVYKPKINSTRCNSCGICIDICPVINFWERDIEQKKKKDDTIQFDTIFGYYYHLFFTHSLNSKIRYDCSSGGFVTSLLTYLLDNHIIDYVVVANQDEHNFYVHYPKITTNKADVIQCSGSKYIPITQCSIIDEIIKNKGTYAFVGLPCHINGLSQASERFPILKDRIKFKISLFCGGTSNIYATKYLLKLLNIDESTVHSIIYRGGGWPGFFKITQKDGNVKQIPYKSKIAMGGIFSSPVFRPLFCTMCSDPFGRLSDVSVGDAWLKRFKDDNNGKNIIIIRNKELNNIIKTMAKNKKINLLDATEDEVINSNKSLVNSRYQNLNLKIKYFNKFFKQKFKHTEQADESYPILNRFMIFNYLLARKYIMLLNKRKIIDHLPLCFILLFSLLNLVEQKVMKK